MPATALNGYAPPPPGPEHGRPADLRLPHSPMFFPDAIEILFVSGTWGGGPCTAWFRLHSPIVAGETPSALQRLAAAGDFGNGISATLSWDDYLYINPDLTLYVEREPVGEWICLESETRIARRRGRFGRERSLRRARPRRPRHPGATRRPAPLRTAMRR